MPFRLPVLPLAALLLGSVCLPTRAESSASSAVSDSVSLSVGRISNSIGRSSDSSSKNKDVAEGDYRVVEMAAVVGTTGPVALLRVKLQAVAEASADGELTLTLPVPAAEQGQLAPGVIVSAQLRPYGLAFAAAVGRQPFFLALRDDWYKELDSKPVVL